MTPRICVVYFSLTGTVSRLAEQITIGAVEIGAEVRLRGVPDEDLPGIPGEYPAVPPPVIEDLEWADGMAFGSPTRFGNVSAQLKKFLDSTGVMALRGHLADKAVSGFTSASSPHGGQEATLLALYHTMCHWGSVIVPTGYTDPSLREIGGNPYGLSVTARPGGELSDAEIQAARFFGRRLADLSARLSPRAPAPDGRSGPMVTRQWSRSGSYQ